MNFLHLIWLIPFGLFSFIIILLLLAVRVRVVFEHNALEVWAGYGPGNLQVYPRTKKEKKVKKEHHKKEKAPKGFYYNVPGSALITIECPDFNIQQTLPIAQFGYTTHLNAALTNNKTARITFNPELGTITKISR